ncbi:MAG TPA: hypothetical protein VMV69_05565 [Pirellulales bacterium]|nr:hypothetical protein [Pirellulales bacterium]
MAFLPRENAIFVQGEERDRGAADHSALRVERVVGLIRFDTKVRGRAPPGRAEAHV